MSKNNKSSINRSKRSRQTSRPRRRNRGNNNSNPGIMNTPVRSLTFSPSTPGRASVRSTFEVFNVVNSTFLSYQDFNNWAGNVRSLLTPFLFFRVADVRVQARISGGTSSPNSIAFNLSNAYHADGTTVAILNDDYSAIATAAVQPTLRPPRSYWTQGARTWYAATDPVAAVTQTDLVTGTISFEGSGGATPSYLVGWITVEMEIEFHTLA